MRLVILLVSFLLRNLSCTVDAVEFKDCGSSKSNVISVTLSPCNTSPCVLKRGKKATVDILFTATRSFNVGAARVQAGLPSGFRKLSMTASDVCDHLTPGCPMVAGGTYSFSYSGQVPQRTTPGQMSVRWEMLDANLNPFLCVEFGVRIV